MTDAHPPERPKDAQPRSKRYWDLRYAGAELLWSARPNRFLVAEASALPPGRALDVACGEGRNAVWLAEQGWEVDAVDFSAAALAKAELLAAERGVGARWILADLGDYVPPDGEFDLVIVLYLQLPADERRPVLARAAAAVAAGGTMLVVGHDRANLTDGYGGPTDPDVLFTAEEIAAELSGLTVEKAVRVERPVPVEGGERIALDALVRAVKAPDGEAP
jgi:SAM-dependent methyltransferase